MVSRRISRVRSGLIAFIALCVLAALPQPSQSAPYADLVMDARTGEVLHAENADTRLHPASLTKMMTLYIAFEAIERGEISLDTKVTISKNAAAEPPSKLGLKAGQKIALRYLIRAAAIKSANDAATAIGEAIEGSESAFAKRMNRTAKALGMERSSFRNAHGLTAEGHLSTARDMSTLGRRLFYDFPQYYNIFSRRTADAGMAQVSSTNRRFLDSYEGADGIKTGFTNPAGFNLTASAQRGNKRIIATLLGGKSTVSRNARMAELLDIGFGKAPNRAVTQEPARPNYDALEVEDQDMLASAIADAVASGIVSEAPAAGKTLRVNAAVSRSPRPASRPVAASEPAPVLVATAAPVEAAAPPEEMQTALAESIGEVLQEVAAEPGFVQTTAPQPESQDIALAVSDSPVAATTVTPPETTGFVQTTEPQPESLALVEVNPALPAASPPATATLAGATDIAIATTAAPSEIAVAIAAATDARPRPRPATEAAAEEIVTAAVDPAMNGADDLETAAAAVPQPAPLVSEMAVAAPLPAETVTMAPEAELQLAAVPARPAPKASEIVLAEASDQPAAEETLEVVTRISTSGGRQWGINLGKYPSRYEAERVLLQTALVEMSTLDEALRKVANRKGGYDANFVGMTQDTAELACRRLQARASECVVFGPEG